MKNSKIYKIIFAVVAIGLALYLFNLPTKLAVGAKAKDAAAVAMYQHSTSLIGHIQHLNLLWLLVLLPIGLLFFMRKDIIVRFVQRQKPNTALWLALSCVFLLASTSVIQLTQTSIGWHNIVDYGAKGDGTTDNTTTIRAAIAASSNSVLYIPPSAGGFLVTDSLLISNQMTIYGMGGISATSNGSGGKITSGYYANSTILFNQGAKNCFVISADLCSLYGFSVVSTASSTPTSSHGILFNKAIGMRMRDVSVFYFYENVHIVNGYDYAISYNHFNCPVKWNLYIEDEALCDAGDQVIDGNWFYAGIYSGASHLYVASGGGPKITNNKFNQFGGNVPLSCINVNAVCHTVLLIVNGNSLENFLNNGIFVTTSGSGVFSNVIIAANEISNNNTHNTGFNDIQVGTDASSINFVSIQGNQIACQAKGTTTGSYPTEVYTGYSVVTTGTGITCGPNQVNVVGSGGYDNYANTGSSNISVTRGNQLFTIPSGSTAVYDFSNSIYQVLVLNQNTQLQLKNFSPLTGAPAKLVVQQNATGNFTMTGNFSVDFVGPIRQPNPAPSSYTTMDIGNVYDGNGYMVTIEDWRSTDYANLTAQSAAGTIKSITSSGATATYNISGYLNVTAAPVTDVIQYQITYTDETNTAQTISGPLISTLSNNQIPLTPIRAKASTTITVKTNLTTGGGTVAFDAGATIQQVN